MSRRARKKVEPPSTSSKNGGTKLTSTGICAFCGTDENSKDDYGCMISRNDITVHYFCMLFASGLIQRGEDESEGILGFLPADILKEVKRGTRLKCTLCKRVGATIGCVVGSCRRVFHFSCGRKSNVLNQYFDNYSSYCVDHRPIQEPPVDGSEDSEGFGDCAICIMPIEPEFIHDRLCSPCCKNAWYHKSCIQKQATVSGIHFFKCPLCNNQENFQKEMLKFGIYIPDQDAAWEQEPNAFQELLERHSRCDVKKCLCRKGRNYNKDGSKWEIMLCDACGSSGTHMVCTNLKTLLDDFVCTDCQAVARSVRLKKKNQSQGTANGDLTNKAKSSYPGKTQPMKRQLPETALTSDSQVAAKRQCFNINSPDFVPHPTPHISLKRISNMGNLVDPLIARSQFNMRRHSERHSRRLSRSSGFPDSNDDATMSVDIKNKPKWFLNLLQDDIMTGENVGKKFSNFTKVVVDNDEMEKRCTRRRTASACQSKPSDDVSTEGNQSDGGDDASDKTDAKDEEADNFTEIKSTASAAVSPSCSETNSVDIRYNNETLEPQWTVKTASSSISQSSMQKVCSMQKSFCGPKSVKIRKLKERLKMAMKNNLSSSEQNQAPLAAKPLSPETARVPWQDVMEDAIHELHKCASNNFVDHFMSSGEKIDLHVDNDDEVTLNYESQDRSKGDYVKTWFEYHVEIHTANVKDCESGAEPSNSVENSSITEEATIYKYNKQSDLDVQVMDITSSPMSESTSSVSCLGICPPPMMRMEDLQTPSSTVEIVEITSTSQ